MKKTLFLVALGVLLISALLAAVSCGSSSPTTSTAPGTDTQTKPPPGGTTGPDFTPGQTAEIIIDNLAFSPGEITIAPGTTVTWSNEESVTHTVSSLSGAFESGSISPGGSFSFTFNEKGTFEYRCSIHPTMRGTVIVE